MKKIIFINLFLAITIFGFAQKQTFDMVSFDIPKGWDKTVTENGVQLSTKDDGKGNYAAMVIVRSVSSNASARENFNKSWGNLVKGTVKVTEAPSMSDMGIEKGWNVITGQANYTDGAAKGLVTLITATSNEKMANVVIFTNTNKYQEEILAFVNSLEINEPATEQNNTSNENNNSTVDHDNAPLAGKIWEAQTLEKFGSSGNSNQNTADSNGKTITTSSSSIAGLWTNYTLETTGYNVNGMPQYTAGYLRKEYAFYPDGTYVFRNKQWLTKTANILFIYETGTYSVNGNQLTITPKNGKAGFWGKTSSSKEWGKFIKPTDFTLEKTSYIFEITHDPDYGDKIILKPGKPTARDGGKFNAPGDPYEFYYSKRDLESLIDNPPGFKTDFEKNRLLQQ